MDKGIDGKGVTNTIRCKTLFLRVVIGAMKKKLQVLTTLSSMKMLSPMSSHKYCLMEGEGYMVE